MKRSEIYLLAAEALSATNWPDNCCGACYKVARACPDINPWDAADAFGRLFKPEGANLGDYFWPFTDKGYEQRLLALFLAAAIAESENK